VTSLREAIDFIESHRPQDVAEEQESRGTRGGDSIVLPTTQSGGAEASDAKPTTASPAPKAVLPFAERAAAPGTPRSSARLETIAQQILDELKRDREQPVSDFSVTKLLAGVVQVLSLAVLFMTYLNRGNAINLLNTLMLALVLQTLTISLLIMQRQK